MDAAATPRSVESPARDGGSFARVLAPALVALAFVAWSAAFIASTSHDVDGVRWFCLFDDAMISMRYAQNLVDGHGLTWNPREERVEGFTNLLWTLWMAACHLLPVGIEKASLLVQLSGLALLLANLFVVLAIARELRPDGAGEAGPLASMLLLAFYYPVNNWTLQGMEVGAVALCVAMATLSSLRSARAGAFSRAPYWWMGAASLTRLDAFAPFLVVAAWLAWADRPRWKRRAIEGVLFIAAFLAAQTLFRLWYYGEALPNTYHLKMTGYPSELRALRGLIVLWDFLRWTNPLLFLFGFAILFARRDRAIWLPVALVATQLAYSAYVGGDAWEGYGGSNRFISVAMPLYFALFGLSLAWTVERLGARAKLSSGMIGVATAALVLLALFRFNMMNGTTGTLGRLYLVEPPLFVPENYANIRDAQLAMELTTPEASLAVNWAGAPAYFTGRPIVDFSGKNDKALARREARVAPGWRKVRHFVPGHAKWDYEHSIGELKPDAILQLGLMASQRRAARNAMGGAYVEFRYDHYASPQSQWGEKQNHFLLRSDSPRVRWERARELLAEREAELAAALVASGTDAAVDGAAGRTEPAPSAPLTSAEPTPLAE